MKTDISMPEGEEVESSPLSDPFSPGALAVVSLGNPKEKFWGMLLSSAPAGLSLSGVDISSLEEIAKMVKGDEPCGPVVVFFPMHRVERMELDQSQGGIPSLAERFFTITGQRAPAWLQPPVPESASRKIRAGKPRAAGRPA